MDSVGMVEELRGSLAETDAAAAPFRADLHVRLVAPLLPVTPASRADGG